jgi:hypothetical protein
MSGVDSLIVEAIRVKLKIVLSISYVTILAYVIISSLTPDQQPPEQEFSGDEQNDDCLEDLHQVLRHVIGKDIDE